MADTLTRRVPAGGAMRIQPKLGAKVRRALRRSRTARLEDRVVRPGIQRRRGARGVGRRLTGMPADVVTEDGPLVRGVFSWGGFVSYRDLDGVDDLDALIARTVAYYRDDRVPAEYTLRELGGV